MFGLVACATIGGMSLDGNQRGSVLVVDEPTIAEVVVRYGRMPGILLIACTASGLPD